jgi:hypothetical protein
MKISERIINEDYTLTNIYEGSIEINSGKFILQGILRGSLTIKSNAIAEILGTQQGHVLIESNAKVSVSGVIQGSVTIQNNATLVIEPDGKMAGSFINFGTIILRGMFGGSQIDHGKLIIEEGGKIIQPVIRNGTRYYNF